MLSKIPMGRFGTPDEVAAMVGWLCTEDCSFSTGAVFDPVAAADLGLTQVTFTRFIKKENHETRSLWQPRQGKARPHRCQWQAARPERVIKDIGPEQLGDAALAKLASSRPTSCRWSRARRATAAPSPARASSSPSA
jgi:hypothetical protein